MGWSGAPGWRERLRAPGGQARAKAAVGGWRGAHRSLLRCDGKGLCVRLPPPPRLLSHRPLLLLVGIVGGSRLDRLCRAPPRRAAGAGHGAGHHSILGAQLCGLRDCPGVDARPHPRRGLRRIRWNVVGRLRLRARLCARDAPATAGCRSPRRPRPRRARLQPALPPSPRLGERLWSRRGPPRRAVCRRACRRKRAICPIGAIRLARLGIVRV
mmetsp:Transcript_6881/g.22572  ORF Transcript_6881/g.22572 Transcript_6881/m.22572 type:complete len:213 (-) Transcript_6881:225-863(-)